MLLTLPCCGYGLGVLVFWRSGVLIHKKKVHVMLELELETACLTSDNVIMCWVDVGVNVCQHLRNARAAHV